MSKSIYSKIAYLIKKILGINDFSLFIKKTKKKDR